MGKQVLEKQHLASRQQDMDRAQPSEPGADVSSEDSSSRGHSATDGSPDLDSQVTTSSVMARRSTVPNSASRRKLQILVHGSWSRNLRVYCKKR